MAFNVTLKQSGRQFQVEADETVLAAALRQNVHLPYGCKNGACGSCKGTIVQGQFEQGPHSASALSNDERTRGLALLCCSKPQSDLEVDVREIAGVDGVQVKKLPCRVAGGAGPAGAGVGGYERYGPQQRREDNGGPEKEVRTKGGAAPP
ncbi:2Fe-2S iron-sulfur cluster-binding protein, partial [Burkholderia pseudomallei]|uniref:2Fe-2S iron-sulfur cluster-binding protein n=1 Tax=Burkholderia pseudomallei TaxID=28450 RepID=UPI001EF1D87A